MAKKSKQRKQKKSNRVPRKQLRPPSWQLIEALEDVERLTRRKKWAEALEALQELDRRFHNRPEVLGELLDVCLELGDFQMYQVYCHQLHKLLPNDPDILVNLAGVYLTNLYPALALQTYYQYLERFPDDEMVPRAEEAVALLEDNIESILDQVGVHGENALALAAQHDEVRALVETGEYGEARRVANRLLKLRPDFIPVLNNLSQADFIEGHHDKAIAAAERVLSLEPTNFQALGNLTRFQYLSGQAEAARQTAERLKNVHSDNHEFWLKTAEALTCLGDDKGILETTRAAEEAGYLNQPNIQPVFHHYAAVAAMHQGDEKEARRHWKASLKLDATFDLAQENLADLDKPIGERQGPWPFPLGHWLSTKAYEDLTKFLLPATRQNAEGAVARAVNRYFKKHPEVEILIPILLARGDPVGRDFALNIARMAKTPEMLAALYTFALSQHGPDAMRHQALNLVDQAGMLPSKEVQMWVKGAQQEITLMGFEIYEEPVEKYSEEVSELMSQAMDALYEGELEQAERLNKQALALEPNAPEILNNLAACYSRQKRNDEAEALIHRMRRDFPDYFFGIIAMANLHMLNEEFDEAEELLEKVRLFERLHISEYRALAQSHIQLYLRQNEFEGARAWVDMWENIDSDEPELKIWRMRIMAQEKSPLRMIREKLGF